MTEPSRTRLPFKWLRNIDWNEPSLHFYASILVPIAFGIWSVLLGQDVNWDLYNYHFYNPFAFLNDKLATDFAPGGFQNFFNPTLDIPYYVAVTHWPPILVGFLMGLLHGLNFVLLLAIGRRTLTGLIEEDQYRVPLLLALAGCLTANFLSEIGNTMGDNSTALFVLGSLLLILHAWASLKTLSTKSTTLLLLAGAMMGIGCGLKLTNIIYPISACIALFVAPAPWRTRICLSFVFGLGVLGGIALSAGHWFYTMWQTFGNPLFPQFTNVFPNDLAAAVSLADTSWIPKSLWQQLLWPFIISINAKNAGQVELRQIIWAIVYVMVLVYVAVSTVRLRQKMSASDKTDNSASLFLVVFIVVTFIIWMNLFGVYRYLVPAEILTPFVVFILCSRVFSYAKARVCAAGLIGLAVLIVVTGGAPTWGHKPWSSRPFYAELPPLESPSQTTVLITEGDPAWSWLAASFPVEVAFSQLVGNFPQGSTFKSHIQQMVKKRGGSAYALFQGHYDSAKEQAARLTALADSLGLMRDHTRCSILAWLTSHLSRFDAEVLLLPEPSTNQACTLDIHPKTIRNIEVENHAEQEKASKALANYGFQLVRESCTLYRSGVGDSVQPYQWCKAR